MRPVNLIPPEQRRGDRAPTRTGALAYLVVGALALALVAVTAVVLTNNQITDRTEEVATLEAREAAVRERAEALAPYAEFAGLEQARSVTVDMLARSRFDWERVLRELARVLPADVQLTNVTGTVSPGVTLEDGAANPSRDEVEGPALELTGCGRSQETVAELAAALEDIDGVTRVGVNRSATTDDELGGAGGSGGGGQECDPKKPVFQFEMIAAFDEVAVATAEALATPPAPRGGSGDDGTPAAPGQQAAKDSAAEQTEKARDATKLVPGVAK